MVHDYYPLEVKFIILVSDWLFMSLAPTHVQYNLHEPSYNLHEPGYNRHEPGYNRHELGYNRRSFTL